MVTVMPDVNTIRKHSTHWRKSIISTPDNTWLCLVQMVLHYAQITTMVLQFYINHKFFLHNVTCKISTLDNKPHRIFTYIYKKKNTFLHVTFFFTHIKNMWIELQFNIHKKIIKCTETIHTNTDTFLSNWCQHNLVILSREETQDKQTGQFLSY